MKVLNKEVLGNNFFNQEVGEVELSLENGSIVQVPYCKLKDKMLISGFVGRYPTGKKLYEVGIEIENNKVFQYAIGKKEMGNMLLEVNIEKAMNLDNAFPLRFQPYSQKYKVAK